MKWISVVAGCAFLLGITMAREGKVAYSMKAENREALMLYGVLVCAVSLLWLVIHGCIALSREVKDGSNTT